HLDWNGIQVHLIDHPGYADFIGEVAASTPLLDGLVIVVDAATGVQVGTDNAWKYAEQHQVPRAFFVNKLDREHTDFKKVVNTLRETYGKHCVPLVVPLGEGPNLQGVVNIFDEDTSGLAEEIAQLKQDIADVVAETDDAMLEKYLETGELTPEEFHSGLHDGITAGKIVPIIAGSVVKGFGMRRLLNVIADSFPGPSDRHVVAETASGEKTTVKISADAPFLGQVFRSVVDPFVGHLTLFRVLTGTLHGDSDFYNVSRGVKERTGKLYLLNGKEQTVVNAVGPGDLAAMTKLKNTHFGDTIAAVGTDLKLPRVELPGSMVKLAIVPKSRADEDKIGEALNRLAEEDPTFSHYRDEATGDHLVRGMGDLQLDILLDRMRRKYHVEAETRTPKVAYRETVKGKAEVQGRHKKQTGGHGQFGDVHLRIAPNERGGGYQFVDKIVGGVVPRQYIPAVDKGCLEALSRGVISGNPVVDIIVELFYGSYHTVDSSEMAFKIAASIAIQKGVREAKPVILEPIMEISVTVPEEYMGDIAGHLNSRRGRILGMDSIGGGRQRIRANVPEAEILRYSTELRSMTSGRGMYELKYSHYDEAPETVSRELISAYEKARAAGE
ncbi:MAG: elongation factor G, partial [Candidatus Hydrogenedentes bacterium]|nr:elongation factor G [Candidatus Hydrogenedentota bacterium]